MCAHCDGLDAADYLLLVLGKLLGKTYPEAAGYEYARIKFKEESMFDK